MIIQRKQQQEGRQVTVETYMSWSVFSLKIIMLYEIST